MSLKLSWLPSSPPPSLASRKRFSCWWKIENILFCIINSVCFCSAPNPSTLPPKPFCVFTASTVMRLIYAQAAEGKKVERKRSEEERSLHVKQQHKTQKICECEWCLKLPRRLYTFPSPRLAHSMRHKEERDLVVSTKGRHWKMRKRVTRHTHIFTKHIHK